MKKINSKDSAWFRARTLKERIAASSENLVYDVELGKKRLKKWKSESTFADAGLFAQRLAQDGITEAEFAQILGQNIAPIPLKWLRELEQAYENLDASDITNLLANSSLSRHPSFGFLNAISPILAQGIMKLKSGLNNLPNLPDNLRNIHAILLDGLPEQLLFMVNATLVLEMNVSRLQGLLTGNHPQERFSSFIRRLQNPEVQLTLWEEYPVLAKQVLAAINRWVENSLEFIQHLSHDWRNIYDKFQPPVNPGKLVKINRGEGDSHNNGKSVIIITFASGWQLVYKPRSLAVDEHFQNLLLWLNQKGFQPAFRTLQILDQGNYGWVEFVNPQQCHSADAVKRFYQRQGGYLALLYALEATDFHFENLIAAGEHPVLIDLESLFHPRSEILITAADNLDREMVADSVLRVGLLPQVTWGNTQAAGIDLSGLGGAKGQLTPEKVPQLVQVGTDTMRVERQQAVIPGSQNRPQLNQQEVNVQEYTDAITEGFTAVYGILLQHRPELLKILDGFAADEVRVVMRASRTYALLLRESYHPDFLRDALERDRLFDKLWIDVKNRPQLSQIITAERDALWKNDIPLFSTYPHSRDLYHRDTGLHIPNFFPQSGIELVHHRLNNFSEKDLQKQTWFIQAALATLEMAKTGDNHQIKLSKKTSDITVTNTATTAQFLEIACKIGDRLELLAHKNGEFVNWMGISLTPSQQWTLAPLSTDLYAGIPGVALFLAYLGEITQNHTYTNLAQAAINTLKQRLETHSDTIKFIGGFSGWGGIIYTYTHLGILWREPELIADAITLVAKIPPLIAQDQQLDIIAGAAGCIGSLISLYQTSPKQLILDVAIQCGEHLLTQAQTTNTGIGWKTPASENQPLTGFSHGAAGFAWALWKLAVISEKQEFQAAATAAINYERSHFDPIASNWLDLRQNEVKNSFMTAWCNGAPGLGLGRLSICGDTPDEIMYKEITTAIQTTIKQGFGNNHCLCHGDLGNIDLLLIANAKLNNPEIAQKIEKIATEILSDIQQNNFRCGVPLGIETPSLMVGLAGIGYGLLRLTYPQLIPSILLLEPPKKPSPSLRLCASA
ncbi:MULTISPECIES: type 2 lanthipeptide synthetase LanM family protein [Cyanophyceae]|uniref:type 2 lanthipeptide synthetase LanM family protein n=1 Tax=Cyanophyceae TaxID=3028117 RepID=UPI00232DA2E0|nr:MULTISPECIES: type 2 lanthipeptide synthetase LanM family protein [Cyanophyceae]MDB9304260.1 type 2 lanthipeptide synthetase LanM family protein [Nodularia spumigena CS-591/12]MDB9339654.1 type 2 lanthipeptide synthetase LanM family protein [Nodularia spumigena CS-589/07]MDB9342449.1 type 2 lanthipeptide synthetase LanM family protein [Nodularia spumigena CS-588/06]MDB9347481.1 type 2 lanthipeptide synthetase LanM family protein [Nodularia spumigena CS-588/01]MDB9353934.1 type 2 lanthipepti